MGDREEEEGLVTRLFNEVLSFWFCSNRKCLYLPPRASIITFSAASSFCLMEPVSGVQSWSAQDGEDLSGTDLITIIVTLYPTFNEVISEIMSCLQGRGLESSRVSATAGQRLENWHPGLQETGAGGQVCGHAVWWGEVTNIFSLKLLPCIM